MPRPGPCTADPAVVSRWIADRQRLLRHEAESALCIEVLDYDRCVVVPELGQSLEKYRGKERCRLVQQLDLIL